MRRVTIGKMQESREISSKAIVDFVESVRIKFTATHVDNYLDALETLTCDLETRFACNIACANALLEYARAKFQGQADQQQPWASRLEEIRSAALPEARSQRNRRSETAIATVTMFWGRDIVNHYKLTEMGRPTALLLEDVAKLFREWSQAKGPMNAALLNRQLEHLSSDSQEALRIGDHMGGDRVKDSNIPLLKKDLELVIEWAQKGIVMAGDHELLRTNDDTPQKLADYIATWTSGERTQATDGPSANTSTCSHRSCHHFALDKNGLIVPRQEPTTQGKRRSQDTSAPRRKRSRNTGGNAGQSISSADCFDDGLFVGGQPSRSTPDSRAAEIDAVNADAEAPNTEAQDRDHTNDGLPSNASDGQTAGPSERSRRDSGYPGSTNTTATIADWTNLQVDLDHQVRNSHLRRSSRFDSNASLRVPDTNPESRTASKRPASKAPASKRPASKAHTSKTPATKTPAGKTPTGRRPAGKAPAGKRPGLRPAIFCSPPSRVQNSLSRSPSPAPASPTPDSLSPASHTSTIPTSPAPTSNTPFSSAPAFENTLSTLDEGGGTTTEREDTPRQASQDPFNFETAEIMPHEFLDGYNFDGHLSFANFPFGDDMLDDANAAEAGEVAAEFTASVEPEQDDAARLFAPEAAEFAASAEPDPIFDNEQDNAARLFSPEPTAIEEGSADALLARRNAQLASVRDQVASIARIQCKQLAPWASSIRLAKVHTGILSQLSNGANDEEVNSLDHASLTNATRTTLITRPTIVTGPFPHSIAPRPQLCTDLRDFTGAQIRIKGDTWLRSLSGTHCCMAVLEPNSATADPTEFDPDGRSVAIMLNEGDILWMPQNIPYAAVTLDPGTMQVGNIRGGSLPAMDTKRLLEIVDIVLCSSESSF